MTVFGQDEALHGPTLSTGVGDESIFSDEDSRYKIGQFDGGDDLSIDDDDENLDPSDERYDPYINPGMKNEQTQVGPGDLEPVDPDVNPDVKPVPGDNSDEVPEDDDAKVHLDMVDQSVKHMQED